MRIKPANAHNALSTGLAHTAGEPALMLPVSTKDLLDYYHYSAGCQCRQREKT